MESRKWSLGLAAVAVVVAVVLFVVLRDSGSDSNGSSATNPASQPLPKGGGDNQPSEGEGDNQRSGGGNGRGATGLPTIVLRGGQPVGGVQDLSFRQGDRIRFRVKSDVSDEVHLHGYDLLEPVKAGGSVEFDVPASLEGVFEAELEERAVPLAEITVQP
jgi:hypothetical protein